MKTTNNRLNEDFQTWLYNQFEPCYSPEHYTKQNQFEIFLQDLLEDEVLDLFAYIEEYAKDESMRAQIKALEDIEKNCFNDLIKPPVYMIEKIKELKQ